MDFDGFLFINQMIFFWICENSFSLGGGIIPPTLFPHLSTLEPCDITPYPQVFLQGYGDGELCGLWPAEGGGFSGCAINFFIAQSHWKSLVEESVVKFSDLVILVPVWWDFFLHYMLCMWQMAVPFVGWNLGLLMEVGHFLSSKDSARVWCATGSQG